MIGKRTIVAAAIMAALATFIVFQVQYNARLNKENQALHEQLSGIEQLRAENARLAKTQITTNEPALPQDQLNELLRLRGQVGSLKRQLAETPKVAAHISPPVPQPGKPVDPNWENVMAKQQYIAKMNISRSWTMAFVNYAGAHQGQYPTSFDQAAMYLDEDHKDDALAATGHFEIVYQGAFPPAGGGEPSKIIVLRETEAMPMPDGSYNRAYAFADGHAEIHHFADGNFGPWESERLQKPPGQ